MKPHEPLSPEERDLAARLARLGGPREPAPALDARILAAARAAVSAAGEAPAPTPATTDDPPAPADPKVVPLRPRKTTPRWPLGLGLAATLVLAAGIGWRLHGDGETGMQAAEDAAAPSAVFSAEEEQVTEAVILDPPVQRTPPPPPPPAGIALPQEAQRMRTPPPFAQPRTAVAEAPPEFVADASAVAADAAAAPIAAEPPAAANVLTDTGAAEGYLSRDKENDLDSVVVTGTRASPERTVGAAEYTRTPLNERREQATQIAAKPAATSVSGRAGAAAKTAPPPAPAAPPAAQNAVHDSIAAKRRADVVGGTADERKAETRPAAAPASAAESEGLKSDEAFDDQPPASADSPEVRQAWLQRIRDLIARGRTEAARNSLQEFRRRYPNAELPEDLRKLAATLPPPSP